jgi:hypothetical protein
MKFSFFSKPDLKPKTPLPEVPEVELPDPKKINGQRIWPRTPPREGPMPPKIVTTSSVKLFGQVCNQVCFRLHLHLEHFEKDKTKEQLEDLAYREDIMFYVRDGLGEVLSCMHDIVGGEEYTKLSD